MANGAEQGTPQNPETVLESYPFLRTFIGPGVDDAWEQELEKYSPILESEVGRVVGEKWVASTVVPLALEGEYQMFFETVDDRRQHEGVKAAILCGYEAGDDAGQFISKIVEKLQELEILRMDGKEASRVEYYIASLVSSGIFFRKLRSAEPMG